jgi:transposase InsO family protein
VADRTVSGGALKWRTLADENTRELLALHVGRAVNGADVRRALARAVGRRGAPGRGRGDNGSEFIGAARAKWLPARGTKALPVAPAGPWENGFGESFNSRFRDEFPDARAQGAWFRRGYSTVRPHSPLGQQTPRKFGDACARRERDCKPKPRR